MIYQLCNLLSLSFQHPLRLARVFIQLFSLSTLKTAMSSRKPRFTVLAALCSIAAISVPVPAQGSYVPMGMDSSAPAASGSIPQSASMMSLSASVSQSLQQQSPSHPGNDHAPGGSSSRSPLGTRGVTASRKKFKSLSHNGRKGRKSHKGVSLSLCLSQVRLMNGHLTTSANGLLG